jgi:hypothetical protein
MCKKLLLLLSIILSGCTSVQQTIYIQDVEVNGPLNNPPIFISDNRNGITVSPWFSFNSNRQINGLANHSNVNINTGNLMQIITHTTRPMSDGIFPM